jgi:hypothetical protein
MTTWSKEELQKIAKADDLHIAPFRGANPERVDLEQGRPR